MLYTYWMPLTQFTPKMMLLFILGTQYSGSYLLRQKKQTNCSL